MVGFFEGRLGLGAAEPLARGTSPLVVFGGGSAKLPSEEASEDVDVEGTGEPDGLELTAGDVLLAMASGKGGGAEQE